MALEELCAASLVTLMTMPRLRHSFTADGTMGKARLNDFDVTGTVQVSSTAAVREHVEDLCQSTWQDFPFEPVTLAFEQFDRMFAGEVADYYGVDTVYHDRQHTLDVTLALARLMAGHDRTRQPLERLGAERAAAGLIIGCSTMWISAPER